MSAESETKTKRINWRISPVGILVVTAVILFLTILVMESKKEKNLPTQMIETSTQTAADPYITPDTPLGRLTVFAKMHGMSLSDWPSPLIEFMEKYPETESYVMNYPFYQDVQPPVDLTTCLDAKKMPLLLQWDARWGYTQYSGELFGMSGCGPTCLAMVCLHLLQDAKYTPCYIADFSQTNGYYTEGMGSSWTLISEGAEKLGIVTEELMPDANVVMEELEAGNPIICVVGPGDFSYTGHFIVLAGVEDGLIRVNDPNSRINSQQLWDYERIADQIEALWACRLPQAEE